MQSSGTSLPAVPLTSTTAVVLALGTAVLSLGLVCVLVVQVGRLRRALDALGGTGDVVEVAERSAAVRSEVDALRGDVQRARADLSSALRHVAVVRYDAFGDLSGTLSFSAALLDDAGDGLLLSSINGRTETRTYAKGVTGGGSKHALSPEEQEALDRASSAR